SAKCQKQTFCAAVRTSLFDHLVGEREHCGRNFKVQSFRGLEIDDQLEFGGLHDRKVARPLTFENPRSVEPSLPIHLSNVRAVAYQTASRDEFAKLVHRGERVARW